MANVQIKNKQGTTGAPTCGCGTWIAHWKNAKNATGGQGCKVSAGGGEHTEEKKPRVGAHVTKSGSTDKKTYIVPMCPGHNGQGSDVEMTVDSAELVRAVKLTTCSAG